MRSFLKFVGVSVLWIVAVPCFIGAVVTLFAGEIVTAAIVGAIGLACMKGIALIGHPSVA